MVRVVIPPHAVQGELVTVAVPETVHHLRHVLRVRPGDRLECVDGAGRRYAGPILRCAPRHVVMQVEERSAEPSGVVRLWMAQALIKPGRFDWVVQKATELGVDRITPLMTQRAVARVAPAQREAKRLRWQRIAASACAQCGRAAAPQVDAPTAFTALLPRLGAMTTVVMPTLAIPSVTPLEDVISGMGRDATVAVLIGPEGDFTREEVAEAQRRRAVPVSLGRLTLRSETAALATLAILQYIRGRL